MNDSMKWLAGMMLAACVSLIGWCLIEVHDMSNTLTKIETKMDIWHSSVSGGGVSYRLVSGIQQQRADDFATKSMLVAADAIVRDDCQHALKVLLLGLEEQGYTCRVSGKSLDCRR